MRLTPRHILLLLALGAAAGTALAAGQSAAPSPVTPIASLDVPRYMGTWYEIARYPNRFQKNCARATTATYRLRPDKTVEVINRCRRADGRLDEAAGTARQIGAPDAPTLEVRFAPDWLSLLPMVWGDYWVIDLDPGYQLAAVSDPRRKYLWILSRTPAVPGDTYQALLERLAGQGFDLGKLEPTPQGD